MDKKIVSEILLTLLLIGILASTFSIQRVKSEPRTWTVDDDGKADFSSIQAAINGADPGDTIQVSTGTYCENVDVYKSVNIIGEGASLVVVNPSDASDHVIEITANGVNFTGFNIFGGLVAWISGIRLSAVINCKISNNIVSNNFFGVHLRNSECNYVENNQVTQNGAPSIYIEYSSYNLIRGNNASYNGGVSGWAGRGIQIDRWSNNNTIQNNLATFNEHAGILEYNFCQNNLIENNTVCSNGRHGIYIGHGGSWNVIRNNFVKLNGWLGIGICQSSNNFVYHNNLIDNDIQGFACSNAFNNKWDDGYPSGGNYWSDYEERYPNATEIDESGIWNTPYVIDENNQDSYPLMEPWIPKPLTPIEASEELIETIESWNLTEGTENSLTSKLDDVIHLLEKGNENGAIHKLMDFIDQVEGLRGKKLTDDQADYLIAEAQRIIDLIQG